MVQQWWRQRRILVVLVLVVVVFSSLPMLVNAGSPNGVSIDDSERGTGTNQFNYLGSGWTFCNNNCGSLFFQDTKSFSNTGGDSLALSFVGGQIKFYSGVAPEGGQAAISVDSGTPQTISFYGPVVKGNTLLWTSPVLSSGTHTLTLRVLGSKIAASKGTTVIVDRVEILPGGQKGEVQQPTAPCGTTSASALPTFVPPTSASGQSSASAVPTGVTPCSGTQPPIVSQSVSAITPEEAVCSGLDTNPPHNFIRLPLSFIPNVGQSDISVHSHVRVFGGMVYFTPDETVLLLPVPDNLATASVLPNPLLSDPLTIRAKHHETALRIRYDNANHQGKIANADLLPGTANFLIGDKPDKWHLNLPTYASTIYEDLYPGVKLCYNGPDGLFKSTYTLAPNVDPSVIRWRYTGSSQESIDATSGDLLVQLPDGTVLTQQAPVSWQVKNGQRISVDVKYAIGTNNSVGFAIGTYDPALPLVIDPTLTYSTYLGGSGWDAGQGIAVDSVGNTYVTGFTYSPDFPTANAFQPGIRGGSNAFIAKLNASGTALVYSTFLGGDGNSGGSGIAVDSATNVYVAGSTSSSNFPLLNAVQTTHTGGSSNDAFVAKLNSAGNGLIFSTYLGGSTEDTANGIAVDSSGNTYVAGLTTSADFPVANALQPNYGGGGYDAFAAKFNPTGGLLYSTYLGGTNTDWANGIAVDSGGNPYLTGTTSSYDFPVKNPLQPWHGTDVFITKINSAGSALVYSTYLGGSGAEIGYAIAVDSNGNAYMGGSTASMSDFPVVNAFQPYSGGSASIYQGIVAKLNATGSQLLYSTYLGGSQPANEVYGIAVDSAGDAVATGYTGSSDFPTFNTSFQTGFGGSADAFVTQFTPQGNTVAFSTYLGGSGADYGYGIAVDNSGNIYVTGKTDSTNFPLAQPLQLTVGNIDAFVSKIHAPITVTSTPVVGNTATKTPLPPSATNTALVPPTNTPTNPPAPTATWTPSVVVIPSITPSATPVSSPSNTPLPPTNTPVIPTATQTSVASKTPTVIPSITTIPPTPWTTLTFVPGGCFGPVTVTCTPTPIVTTTPVTPTPTIVPSATPVQAQPFIGNGDGLAGDYYLDAQYTNLVKSVVDPTVDFDWNNSPSHPLYGNYVRWTGLVQAEYTETYTFSVIADDGVRLWVSDLTLNDPLHPVQPIIDAWYEHPPIQYNGTMPFTFIAGHKYNIQLDYYENGWGSAVTRLEWSSPTELFKNNDSPEVIPQSQLYALRDGDHIGVFNPSSALFLLHNSLDSETVTVAATAAPVKSSVTTTANSSLASVVTQPDYTVSIKTTPSNGFGSAGYLSIAGDWTGKGSDGLGIFDRFTGQWYLTNSARGGNPDFVFSFRPYGSAPFDLIPIVGDWDGNGTEEVGLYQISTTWFYLRKTLGPGTGGSSDWTQTMMNVPGNKGTLKPIIGKWNGSKNSLIGVYDRDTATWYLAKTNLPIPDYIQFQFGPKGTGDTPVSGDWRGLGSDSVGLFDTPTGTWHLRYSYTSGPDDRTVIFGQPGSIPTRNNTLFQANLPIVGKWKASLPPCQPKDALPLTTTLVTTAGIANLTTLTQPRAMIHKQQELDWIKAHQGEPSDAWPKIMAQVKSIPKISTFPPPNSVAATGMSPYNLSSIGIWQSIGPDPEISPFSKFQTLSGRVVALAVDNSTVSASGCASVIYLGGVNGGVWRSTDDGATWNPLMDQQETLTVGAIAVDPNDSSVIYVGTGNQWFRDTGTGIYKVTIPSTGSPSWQLYATQLAGQAVMKILTAKDGTLFAATSNGIFKGSKGGQTWIPLQAGLPSSKFPFYVDDLGIVDTPTGLTLYATIRNLGAFKWIGKNNKWVALSQDPLGKDFNGLPTGDMWAYRSALAVSPSEPDTVYIVTSRVDGSLDKGYFTTDAGSSWAKLNVPGNFTGNQAFHDFYLAVDPLNSDILYVGGIDINVTNNAKDPNSTWKDITNGYSDDARVHFDQQTIAFATCTDISQPCPFYAGNDGGVYWISNGSSPSVRNLNSKGLAISTFYRGDIYSPTLIAGGQQDNGMAIYSVSSTNPGATPQWNVVYGWDAGNAAIDSVDPNTWYAGVDPNFSGAYVLKGSSTNG